MNYEFDGFVQNGWRCPICRRVYSPMTPMCYYCGNGTTVSRAIVDDFDWLYHESVTKAEKPKEDR